MTNSPNSSDQNESHNIELKLAYLGFVQNIIGRMSNNVLIMKTTNVTVLTAMLAFSATETVKHFNWWMFFIPWVLFTLYHAYFLHKETIFINLYNSAIDETNFTFANLKIDMKDLDNNTAKNIFKIFKEKSSFSYFQVGLISIIVFSYLIGVKCV